MRNPSFNFNKLSLKKKQAYVRIHAHICGDGCISICKEKRCKKELEYHPRKKMIFNSWIIYYTNTCEELIKEFISDMKLVFNRKCTYRPDYFEVRIRGTKWIVQELELTKKCSKNWKISEKIKNTSGLILINWIRAFFDDESTVDVQKKMIRVKSINFNGLKEVKEILAKIGFNPKITGPNCDNTWYLNIYSNEISKFYREINFNHPQKKMKIKKIMGRT